MCRENEVDTELVSCPNNRGRALKTTRASVGRRIYGRVSIVSSVSEEQTNILQLQLHEAILFLSMPLLVASAENV